MSWVTVVPLPADVSKESCAHSSFGSQVSSLEADRMAWVGCFACLWKDHIFGGLNLSVPDDSGLERFPGMTELLKRNAMALTSTRKI